MQNQTLSLSQRQQLQMVLAPQLRQSLEMLQLPILELQAMIRQEIEKNPTIEETPATLTPVEGEPTPALIDGEAPPAEAVDSATELNFDKEFEALASLDDEWRDYFRQNQDSRPYTSEDAERRQYMFDSLVQPESLQEHLINQLKLSGLSNQDAETGELIIGSIDDDGYLSPPSEELAASANCDVAHLDDIVSIIQDFHPAGIAARNLRECLLIQLERLGKAESLAGDIVRNHLEELGAHKFADIAKALTVSVDDVQQAAKFIATLDPKPGRVYSTEQTTYISPEVVVQKLEGVYAVVLNDDQLPHLRISSQYRALLADPSTTPEVRAYIRERIQSGAFLIKSIHQRQKTIYRIANEIVQAQTAFLDEGIAHLKPMTMAEIAKAVGVHETTVSRAVSGKYMKTPAGTFELKYFFTPGIKMANGGEMSNKTVRDIVANLVAAEDSSNPLSDQEIMDNLNKQGIHIARRTIAKYRLILRIPPSHMRKSL